MQFDDLITRKKRKGSRNGSRQPRPKYAKRPLFDNYFELETLPPLKDYTSILFLDKKELNIGVLGYTTEGKWTISCARLREWKATPKVSNYVLVTKVRIYFECPSDEAMFKLYGIQNDA